MDIINFFTKLGFGKTDLIPWNFIFKNAADENIRSLGNILKLYLYDNAKQTGAVFYLLSGRRELNSEEIRIIHRRIWNENKADLFIIHQNKLLVIYYAKTDPYYEPIKITEISADAKDEELLQKISKAHFDSGAFWLVYQDALKDIEKKKRTVDVKLIDSLDTLRGELEREYESIISDANKKRETIQAVIDRTLFIKFLEDKKIINSYFYGYYFNDPQLSYKDLLYKKDAQNINKLFKSINSVCNNSLFEEPVIDNAYLTDAVLNLLYHTISQTDLKSKQKQMSLFDFQFDIIPVEFISRIYEAFLGKEQKKQAAYYTPEGLAELILDSVIKQADCGSVLDPSCGSGVFLVLAFRKMLKSADIESPDTKELIKKRNEFLKSNIFGIEKEPAARRLTIFSLYLEMLNNIEPEKVKQLIKENIAVNDFKLFPEHFDKNILCADALETDEDKQPFKGIKFDFILGNPPWKKVTEQDKEDNYWKKYRDNFTSEKQLSQFFLHKVEQWSKKTTRFGFVVNSSNFQNETKKFQNFFYNTYDIEKIYELTDIKKILFKSAKEPAVTVIFTNQKNKKNTIEYLSPDLTEFAQKFGIILLKQKDIISIKQNDLLAGKVSIRDFLYGSHEDIELCEKILKSDKNQNLEELLLKDEKNYNSKTGKKLTSGESICDELGIDNWDDLSNKEQKQYRKVYLQKHSRSKSEDDFSIPYLTPRCIAPFRIDYNKVELYLKEKKKKDKGGERGRNEKIFEGEKILYARTGNKTKAVFIDKKAYFSADVFVIKLQDEYYYPLIMTILNSTLIGYLLYVKYRKRTKASFTKINTNDLFSLPIPKNITPDIYQKIKELNKIITSGKSSYKEKKEELDDLIFKLYDLDILQRNRIIDFFKKGDVKEKDIVRYCKVFAMVLRPYLKKGESLSFEYYIGKKSLPIDFAGVKVSFIKTEDSNKIPLAAPSISKTVKFLNIELLKGIKNQNILTLKERIYGEHDIYIIKDKKIKSWTTTKASEDAHSLRN